MQKGMEGRIQKIQKGMAGILASYIDTFYVSEHFIKNNTKFQRKRGDRGRLGRPLNPPLEVDGCCSSLLFSILAIFAILFWPV